MRRISAAVLALLFVINLGVASRVYAAEKVVDQYNLTFIPGSLTIAIGDTIRFTDRDRIAHNITITNPDGTSEDKGMDRYNEDIIVPFTKPGVYQVRCKIHPAMKLTVIVK